MKRKAFAKINLTLDVIGKRDDGYHDLAMVMVPLQLFDVVSLELDEKFSFTSNVGYLIKQKQNSIYQIIEEMRKRYGFKENFKVVLDKYIPSQAGLGGGSSDGATTIVLVKQLLELDITKEEMEEIALSVGKDMPFCLYGKSAFVEGTGEKLSFIENNCDLSVLLIKPKRGISTKKAYALLDEHPLIHHDSSAMIEALASDDFPGVVNNLGNSFEAIVDEMMPVISCIKKEMQDFGFAGNLLCGSGSCVFALTQDEELLKRAVKHFRRHYPFVWATKVKRDKNG